MEQQKFFFKEHTKFDLFDSRDENRFDLANLFKLKLVAISNTYGFVAIGYKNVIKILSANVFESSGNPKPEHIALIKTDPNQQIVQIQLNCQETHLIVLTCRKLASTNEFDYILNVYALESINFDSNNNSQSPICVNTIQLENDKSFIGDLCASPSEPDLIAICKSNGVIQIISKILEKSQKIISKQLDAFCICWSPKGKQLASCAKDNRLLIYNHDLEIKSDYKSLTNELKPTNINWLAKKQFIISYEDNDKNPIVCFLEIITDKNSQTEQVNNIDYQNLAYASNSNGVPEISSLALSSLNEWNLIVCAYSRSPDIGLLYKPPNSEYFDVLDIEEYRCTLPLRNDNDDMFPVGFGISLNSKNSIDFGNYGKQAPSPLVLILTDSGQLATFFAINLKTDKPICVEAKKLQFKNIQPPVPSTQPVIFGGVQSALNGSLFNIPTPKPEDQQQFFKPSLNSPQTQPPKSGPTFFAFEKKPSENIRPQTTSQPNFNNFQTQQQQQPQPQIQPSQSQTKLGFDFQSQSQPPQSKPGLQVSSQKPAQLLPEYSVSQQQQQKQLQQQQQEKEKQKQLEHYQMKQEVINKQQQDQQLQLKQQQQLAEQTESFRAFKDLPDDDLKEFCKELEEFKLSALKLFNGKDLSKHLLNLSIIKDTKTCEESYKKLDDEMKVLNEDCITLRTNVFSDFHNLEKLRLLKHNIVEKKSISLINQFDQDPFTKIRYENVKKLYSYLLREVPNLRSYVDTQKRKRQEHMANIIPFDGIYEGLKMIDLSIVQNNKRVNKLVEQIKVARLGRNILHDHNLNSPRSIDHLSSRSRIDSLEQEDNLKLRYGKENLGDLSNKMSNLELNVQSVEQIKFKCEKNSKFYAQMYDLLRKRKQIPIQTVNFDRLESTDSKYEQTKTIPVVLADTSFLHLNSQASPNVSQIHPSTPIQRPQEQQKASIFAQMQPQMAQTQPKPQVQTQPPNNQQQQFSTPPQHQKPVQQQQQQKQVSTPPVFAKTLPTIASTSTPGPPAPFAFNTSSPVAFANPNFKKVESMASLSQINQQASQQQEPQQSVQKNLFPQLNAVESKITPQLTTQAAPAKQEPAKPAMGSIFGQIKPSEQAPKEVKTVEEKTQAQAKQAPAVSSLFSGCGLGIGASASAPSFSFNIGAKPQQQQESQVKQPQQPLTEKLPSISLTKTEGASILSNMLNQPLNVSKDQQKSVEPTKQTQETETKQAVQPVQQKQAESISVKPTNELPSSTQKTEETQNKPNPPFNLSSSQGGIFGAQQNQTNTGGFSFGLGSKPQTSANFSFGNLAPSKSSTIILDTKPPSTEPPGAATTPIIPTSTPLEPVKTLVSEIKTTSQPTQIPTVPTQPAASETVQKTEPLKSKIPVSATSLSSIQPQAASQQEKKETQPIAPPAQTQSLFSFAKAESQPSNAPASSATPLSAIPVVAPVSTTPAANPVVTPAATPSYFSSGFGSQQPAAQSTQPSTGGFFGMAKTTTTTIQPQPAAATQAPFQGTSKFSSFLPTSGAPTTQLPVSNPFSAAIASAAQKPQTTTEVDAEMDSGMNGSSSSNLAGGLSFGGFGLGSKPSNEPTKNIFGGSSFSAQAQPNATAQATKSPFGSILKASTFSTGQPQQQVSAAPLFGAQALKPSTGGLFGSTSAQQPAAATGSSGGGLFSSFSTPQKPSFGAPPAFGPAAPAFGGAPSFGGSPGFGAPGTTSSTGFGAPPTFGSGVGSVFGSATTANNQPTFGSLASGTGGSSFGTFGQNTNNAPLGFGALAQQQQQQQQQQQPGSLFSSFNTSNNQNTGAGFTSPNSSSFTSYRK